MITQSGYYISNKQNRWAELTQNEMSNETIKMLIHALENDDLDALHHARQDLIKLGTKKADAIPGLVGCIRKGFYGACQFLREFGSLASPAFDHLADIFRQGRETKFNLDNIACTLLAIDPWKADTFLFDFIDNQNNSQRYAAISALLGSWKYQREPRLNVVVVSALIDEDADLRELGSSWFDPGEKRCQKVISDVLPLLKHPQAEVRINAALAIAKVSKKYGDKAFQTAVDLIDHPSQEIREGACSVLSTAEAPANTFVPALGKMLQHSDPQVRWAATIALCNVGRAAKKVVKELAAALKDENELVRTQACYALGNVGPDVKSVTGELTEALTDLVPEVRGHAMVALSQIGRKANLPTERLRDIAENDSEPENRHLAVKLLKAILGKRYKPNKPLPSLKEEPQEAEEPSLEGGSRSTRDLLQIKPLAEINLPEGGITDIVVSGDNRLITAGTDGVITIWDLASRTCRGKLTGHGHFLSAMNLSQDNRLLATASYDGTAKIWDVALMKEIRTFNPNVSFVRDVSFSSDSSRLAFACSGHTLRVCDVTGGQTLALLAFDEFDDPLCVEFSPCGNWMFSGSNNGELALWDAKTFKQKKVLFKGKHPVPHISIDSNGKFLAASTTDANVLLWDLGNHQKVGFFKGDVEIIDIKFHPDNRILGIACEPSILFLDVVDRKELFGLNAHVKNHGLCFSPDGRFLLTGMYGKIKIWDFSHLQELAKK